MGAWLRRDWLTVACVSWTGLTLGFAILAYLYPHSHTVYPIYAPAPRRWWQGLDIYVRLVDYYRYSPLFAILLTPFAVLPDCLGGALWKAFNITVYGLGLWVAFERLLPALRTRAQRAALLWLVLPLSLHSMYNGQANLVMLGCMLLGLSAAADSRWNRAALFVALAALVKGYPLALGLLLCGLYPRQFALRFILFLAMGLLLPFATQAPDVVAGQYASWFRHLGDSTSLMRERLRSIDYLLACYGRTIPPRAFALLGLAAGAGVLGMSLWWARRLADPRALLTRVLMLFAVWAVLFGPATESCSYVVLAPAVAWALVEAFQRPGAWGGKALLLLSLFLMGPSVTDFVGKQLRHHAYLYGTQPLGALLFLGYLLARPPAAVAAREEAPHAALLRRAA
jgi:hypothetical protein